MEGLSSGGISMQVRVDDIRAEWKDEDGREPHDQGHLNLPANGSDG